MTWKGMLVSLAAISILSCESEKYVKNANVGSPRGKIQVNVFTTEGGVPAYTVHWQKLLVVDTSSLGFTLKDQPSLQSNFQIQSASLLANDATWRTVWGEDEIIQNTYNQLDIVMKETAGSHRELRLVFKVYDDGLGFRYEFPEQPNLKDFVITDELTQFRMTEDHTCWWIPADYDSYEYLFSETLLSEINADKYAGTTLASRSILEKNAAQTPLTIEIADTLYLSIHEANLTDYAGMTLRVDPNQTLTSSLVPGADGSKVKARTPFKTPWRTIQIASWPGQLVESNLIVNLNEPNQLEDVSWIQPMKYIGIWWAMHLQTNTWRPGPKHGATTENALRHIDFAAAHDIPGLLIEGWNVGWENWGAPNQSEGFDFTTPFPEFDIDKIVAYGKEKGVELVGHHETGGGVDVYDANLVEAMQYYNQLGIRSVKTGYVGKLKPEGEFHHGQWMVKHYRRVVEEAAKNEVMVIAHEPIKPTGIRRTYPNMMAREGLRGSEFNSPWGGGNPAKHLTIIPFTRMLAGPIDYTPGIFKLDLDEFREGSRVPTTLAYQLAEYIVIYGPMQMASDLPEHYEGHPAFQFIKEVPTDWQTSKVIHGKIGDYVTIVRKDRDSENWWLGSLTNNRQRSLLTRLRFLSPNTQYVATFSADGDKAHWKKNPHKIDISSAIVSNETLLNLKLAKGGGQAISFVPASENDLQKFEQL